MPTLRHKTLPLLLLLVTLGLTGAKPADTAPTTVSAMTFTPNGELLVGWRDGKLGTIDLKKKRGKINTLHDDEAEIVALSPDGTNAVIRTRPTAAIVSTKTGAHLVELSDLPGVEGAAYTSDGKLLMISGPQKLLVWREADRLHELAKKGTRLEIYLAKQRGDLQVSLGDMKGSITLDDVGPTLLFTSPQGQLTLWNMQVPGEAITLARVMNPRALGLRGELVLALSQEEPTLRAVSTAERTRIEWDKKHAAHDIIARSDLEPGFLLREEGALSLRDYQTGEPIWSVELTAGTPCGMAMGARTHKGKRVDQRVALCTDDVISVFDLEKGTLLSQFSRAKNAIKSLPLPKMSAKKKTS